ncbi:STAS domain-containing protein [Nonomuraea sp. NPDC051191]|uniref:STAS domain-containing protein n=1 Tax=Nonomuraea sp. NPDC051191 TaxID=3364372 RepID=UPI003787F456
MIDARSGQSRGEVMAMGEHDQDHDGARATIRGAGDGLAIVVWHSAVCPVIGLRGELRAATAAGFIREADRVLASRPAAVVVDLSRLAFCDFEGVGALIGAERRTRELGGRLVLAGARGGCARLLHRTGLDRIFRLLPGPPVAVPSGSTQLVAG